MLSERNTFLLACGVALEQNKANLILLGGLQVTLECSGTVVFVSITILHFISSFYVLLALKSPCSSLSLSLSLSVFIGEYWGTVCFFQGPSAPSRPSI